MFAFGGHAILLEVQARSQALPCTEPDALAVSPLMMSHSLVSPVRSACTQHAASDHAEPFV